MQYFSRDLGARDGNGSVMLRQNLSM